MLGAFLFRGDDVYKSLDMLSGGEKARIALLQLLLSPVNLLVLDEPTNHLDIHSKDVLLEALEAFGGTVVFVSHDRGFIEKLATKVLHLEPGKFMYYPGNYQYYMEQVEKQAGGESLPLASAAGASSATPSNGGSPRNAPESSVSSTQLSWEEQKKRDAERRKIEREVEKLEKEIEELENKKSELETKMGDPAVAAQIDEKTAAWEEASEKLD